MPDLLHSLLAAQWLEITGFASGLLCVWLLIRENIWTFPIGLLYALVSVVVFAEQRLYADVLLSCYYVVMNGYGWYYWRYGGERTRANDLAVGFVPRKLLLGTAALTATATAMMGWLFATQTDADLPYWNSTTTCMSFAAMWMAARKYVENWGVWLIVDVMASTIYLIKGIELYAVLYGVYLAMAIMGWRAWRRSMNRA